MAGKISPDDAFRLLKPSGNKKRAFKLGQQKDQHDPESKMTGKSAESPAWLRYTIISIVSILATCFAITLIRGGYLLLNKKEFTFAPKLIEVPTKTYTSEEIEDIIASNLNGFLSSSTTQERLTYVSTPSTTKSALIDYYDKRHHFDSPLWKIKHIKTAQVDGVPVQMVAYVDLNKSLRYATFIRSNNQFLLEWPSTYAYGELPWDDFVVKRPKGPVQMRAYIRGYDAPPPPGINPKTHFCFVVENKSGDFTGVAMMDKNSLGFNALQNISPNESTPVNLKLGYHLLPNGLHQLTIDELIHFQWFQLTTLTQGTPLRLKH